MESLCCPRCGRAYTDASHQLPGVLQAAQRGHLALALGCGGCGALFFPTLPGVTSAGAGADRTQLLEGAQRYLVLRELGAGGMGTAFAARDLRTDREVCVKRLHASGDEALVAHELGALARLSHPNLVRLLDRYEDAGRDHLVMELVRGEGLDRLIEARGPLGETVALELTRQVLEAVVYAQREGVIHRDLKPANVMIAWEGGRPTVRVLDFGIALVDGVDARGAITGEGNAAGTPYYMAPEQLRGVAVTGQVDVYAAGVMLAEMLLGAPPYSVSSMGDLVFAKYTAKDGLQIDEGSDAVRELIRQFTQPTPEARPIAAHALAAAARLLPDAPAPSALLPLNLDFTIEDGAGRPLGWFNGAGSVAGVSERFEARVEPAPRAPGERRACLAGPDDAVGAFGVLMQRVALRVAQGSVIRLRGELSVEDAPAGAGLFLRADDASGSMLSLENMQGRLLRGTSGPGPVSVEMPVPAGAAWLSFGLLLVGRGKVRACRLALDGTRPHARTYQLTLSEHLHTT